MWGVLRGSVVTHQLCSEQAGPINDCLLVLPLLTTTVCQISTTRQQHTGIVDMEDEDWEEEEDEEDEGESSSSPAAAASSSSSSGDAGEADGDIASMVARALQAETLAATAADAVGKKAPAVKTRQGQGITIVEGDDDDAGGAAGAARRRRRW